MEIEGEALVTSARLLRIAPSTMSGTLANTAMIDFGAGDFSISLWEVNFRALAGGRKWNS